MKKETLRLEHISINRRGISLLKDLSFSIYEGEIYGLLAFNKLGMDALVELLCKNISIDYGSVCLNEKLINNHLYSSGSKTSVETISYRSRIVENTSVIDNIFILNPDFNQQLIFSSNYKKLEKKYYQLVNAIEISLEPYAMVNDLDFFEKCIVALLKAIVSKSPLIICDNLSNILSANDLVKFHEIMRRYSSDGFSFLYICEHHEEAFQICDRAALMDNGRIIKKLDKTEMTHGIMIDYVNKLSKDANVESLLIEDSVEADINNPKKELAITVENLHYSNIKDVSFTVKKGDCLVLHDRDNKIFGDLVKAVGTKRKRNNSIFCSGNISYISENPTEKMIFPNMSYLDNLCFVLGNSQPKIWYNKKFKQSISNEYCRELGEDIYSDDIKLISPFSLYNLIYYRAIIEKAQVVFIKQPFAGTDMFLRTHIMSLIETLKTRGIAVVILAINISDSLKIANELLLIQDGIVQQAFYKNDFPMLSKNRLTLI